ncbi:MAG: Gfo/Idh/MocA family oxidoreductase [Planctomycetes bacterium]|nr:Gfo/Idh/MocA family oxidoreductase [Planctomycetota bacterium]
MAIHVAFIGCGGIARNLHSPAFAKVKDFKVVAVCDVDEARAKAMAADHQCPSYTDAGKMLEKEEIHVVDVVTRETHRPQPLVQCLRAGKHVFCEKPLVGRAGQYHLQDVDILDAKDIVNAWAASPRGTRFGINFNYRFAEHSNLMKADIGKGLYGEPVQINVWANLNCWSHVIDLMRWLNGDVTEVSAHYGGGPAHGPHRSASLKFANGTVGTLSGTLTTGWHHPLLRIEVLGTEARGVITDLCGHYEFLPSKSQEIRTWQKSHDQWRSEFNRTFASSVTSFAEALRDNVPPDQIPNATGLDAYREAEIDANLFVSAQKGQPVRIELYDPFAHPPRA